MIGLGSVLPWVYPILTDEWGRKLHLEAGANQVLGAASPCKVLPFHSKFLSIFPGLSTTEILIGLLLDSPPSMDSIKGGKTKQNLKCGGEKKRTILGSSSPVQKDQVSGLLLQSPPNIGSKEKKRETQTNITKMWRFTKARNFKPFLVPSERSSLKFHSLVHVSH